MDQVGPALLPGAKVSGLKKKKKEIDEIMVTGDLNMRLTKLQIKEWEEGRDRFIVL